MNILNVTNSNFYIKYILLLLLGCQVTSDSLQPHRLQHSRPPCSSPSLRGCPSSCPLNQWCHPTILSSVAPSFLALNLSQLHGLSQWVSSSHQLAKGLELQLQNQSFQWTFRTDFPLGWTGLISLQSKGLSRVFSNTTVRSINSSVLSLLYSLPLTSIHDYFC